ncbi:MAG: ABC transporter permease [Verrucomicrobiota bacterium]
MNQPNVAASPTPATHGQGPIGKSDESRPLVHLENITKTYHLGELEVPVLKGVSLSIARGEMVALMGASGSGKTTLMNILGCLDRPSSGSFWFDGQEMSDLSPDQRALVRTSKLGFVFQSFNLLPRTSAFHNVLMPLDYAVHRHARSEAGGLARSLLKQVGLADRMHHESSQMSGGQQQRVAIARALVNRPMLLLADEPTGNLDSRVGDEILRMFQRLHAEGITVILVTHDPKVASYADRTIRMADGLIEEDSPGPSRMMTSNTRLPDAAAPEPLAEPSEPPPTRPASQTAGTLIPPTLRTALNNLRRHKMRSTLTVLGVIIGVAAVIAMREIGQGSKTAIEKTIASMGASKIPIFPAAVNNGGVSQGAGSYQTLKPGDVEAIARQCPAVTVVVPLVWAQAQAVYGKRNWSPQRLTGTEPGYLATRDWDLEEGDCFTQADVSSRNGVCVIGTTVRRELFEDESPVGKIIRIRNVPFRVVGVLGRRGADMTGQDQDDVIVTPWTTMKFRVNGQSAAPAKAPDAVASSRTTHNLYPLGTPIYPAASAIQLVNRPPPVGQTNIDMIQAKAADAAQVPVAIKQIAAVLRERHHLSEGDSDDFNILDMTEIARASSRTAELMGTLLLVVATISLAVGGVGIMNIMLVSVTERTREIGLRMAVGARRHHILRQFLLEAFLLCLAGGVLGILVGRGTSILVREFQHWTTEISIPAIVVSVAVAGGVGIVFGFYPAWKASRLDPIEALRHE